MQRHTILGIAGALALMAVLSGCATTGGSQVENTVYHNNRMLRNLEGTLGQSVTQLNTTVADLSQRVDTTDREMRQLQGQSEELNHKLEAMSRQLDGFIVALSQHIGITPPRNV